MVDEKVKKIGEVLADVDFEDKKNQAEYQKLKSVRRNEKKKKPKVV